MRAGGVLEGLRIDQMSWGGGRKVRQAQYGVGYYRFGKTVGRLSPDLTARSAADKGVEGDSRAAEVIWERGEVEVVMM